MQLAELSDYNTYGKTHEKNDYSVVNIGGMMVRNNSKKAAEMGWNNLEAVGPISFLGCMVGNMFSYESEAAKHRFQVVFDFYRKRE